MDENVVNLSEGKSQRATLFGFIDIRDRSLIPLQIVLFILALLEAIQVFQNIFETPPSDQPHLYSHLGSYMLAYSAGLIAISFRPARARGLLVFVTVVAIGFLLTAILDITRGRADTAQEIAHITKLIPPFVVWIIASRVILSKQVKKP